MKLSESKLPPSKPLGLVLQRAALISPAQVEVALRDRVEYEELRIGEILTLRGWIKEETANFFAERWPSLVNQQWQYPIGHYLHEAALLNDIQIDIIVAEQRRRGYWLKFGELVLEKQWLKPTTLNFFLQAQQIQITSSSIADLIARVLNSGRMTNWEQERFLEAMLEGVRLTHSELAGIQEIFNRIQTGRLQVINR